MSQIRHTLNMSNSNNAAQQVRNYISSHPAVKECLRRNLINFSALAREIGTRLNVRKRQAMVAAIRRLALRIRKQSSLEHEVAKLFSQSQSLVRSEMIVAVVQRPTDFKKVLTLVQESRACAEAPNIVEGEHVLTIIAHQKLLSRIKSRFGLNVLEVVRDVAQISISLPRRAMYTQGVSARLSSMLAQAGINIIEEITCSGEYLIVIADKDLLSALTLLKSEKP
jgi:hypothetical protein